MVVLLAQALSVLEKDYETNCLLAAPDFLHWLCYRLNCVPFLKIHTLKLQPPMLLYLEDG